MKFGKFISPMLLSEQEKPFDDDEFIYELKFDGIRATLHVTSDGVKIWSRRGNDITRQFPELQSIAKSFKNPVIFDGEIVAFEGGKPSFSSLQKRNLMKDHKKILEQMEENPVIFVAFDCLYDGEDLTALPLMSRKKKLSLYEDSEYFMKAKYVEGTGNKLFQKIKKQGLEGIVAKRKTSLYYIGVRTKEWIKIKNFRHEVFLIGGLVENKARASLLLGEYRDKRFCFVGKVSLERTTLLYAKLTSSKGVKKNPFVDYSEEDVKYVPLKYSCEVMYIERTPSDHLRQPVFKREIEKG